MDNMKNSYYSRFLTKKERVLFTLSGKLPCPKCGKTSKGEFFSDSKTLRYECCIKFNSCIIPPRQARIIQDQQNLPCNQIPSQVLSQHQIENNPNQLLVYWRRKNGN